MMENTPQPLIDLIVSSSRTIDNRYPGLREQNVEEWAKKVAALGHFIDKRFGRKSSHGINGRQSVDTFGIRLQEGHSGQVPFYGVSIIRDNPPINEWRVSPIDHGLIENQYWIVPEDVDFGGNPEPEPEPNKPPLIDLKAIESNLSTLNSQFSAFRDRLEEGMLRVSQLKDAINELNTELKIMRKEGIKARFW